MRNRLSVQQTADVMFVDLKTGERFETKAITLECISKENMYEGNFEIEIIGEQEDIKRLLNIYKRTKNRRIQKKLYKRISMMLANIGFY